MSLSTYCMHHKTVNNSGFHTDEIIILVILEFIFDLWWWYLLVVVQSKHSVVVAKIFHNKLFKNQNNIFFSLQTTYAKHRDNFPSRAHQKSHFPEFKHYMSSCHHHSSSTDLTGHHEKRRGKPVVVEDLALRADECEIETHWRGWSQVCRTKPHVADVCISWYLEEGDVCQADLVEEMRIRRLRVDGQHPAVLVTAKPRVVQVLRWWWCVSKHRYI